MNGLTIGDVAKQARVRIETLRYYEREGLVEKPPRSQANYRLYPGDTVRRVQFITIDPSAVSREQVCARLQ